MTTKGKQAGYPSSTRVAGPSAENLIWVTWDEGVSVFSRSTGETHQLSLLPAEALKRLESNTLSIGALSQDLARECEVADSADWRKKIAAIVSELEQLELIARLP